MMPAATTKPVSNRYDRNAILWAVLMGLAGSRSLSAATPEVPAPTAAAAGDSWAAAEQQSQIFAECLRGANQILHAWIELKRDPATGLYSRGREWNYQNEAADHFASLVFIANYLDPQLNAPGGSLHTTLLNSIRLCATPSGVPCRYILAEQRPGPVDVGAVCEWLRDGLLRITEVLGTDNDFFREFTRATDAVLAEGRRQGGLSKLAPGSEDAGNLIQVLARLTLMSGDLKYLEAAEELADPYLIANPPHQLTRFTFVDHGCELVPGLAELFVVECKLKRPRAESYREPLRKLLDRLLEIGRHPDSGLWYCHANLIGDQPAGQGKPSKLRRPGLTGCTHRPDVPHCWGYVLFAYENYDGATGENRYRNAVEKPMRWLVANRPRFDELKSTAWPWNDTKGCLGDSYESMIILWKRYPDLPGVPEWLDWTTTLGGFRTRADPNYGPGVGGHTDGCIGRNLCAHAMLQSRGVRTVPFMDGLRCGAVERDQGLCVVIGAKAVWSGRLCFDGPRNAYPLATLDWARINEMPQWFVVSPQTRYQVRIDAAAPRELTGRELIAGLEMNLSPGQTRHVEVRPATR